LLCAVVASALAGPVVGQEHQADPHLAHGESSVPDGPGLGAGSHGIVVDFELTDRDGNLVTDEDFLGRYVLLGFGFTHCAHICPTMALHMGQALSSTDKPAVGVFVSVDTERDSPAAIDDYASHFGEAMVGLGGDYEQINAVASNFKVSYAVTKTQSNYTVQHTANIYLIDPEGELVDVFTFTSAPEAMLEAMQ